MTCDLCGKDEATVYLSETINDQSRELHLCESCAREKGIRAMEDFAVSEAGGSDPFLGGGLADLLAGLAEFQKQGSKAKPKPVCAACSMTYEAFRKSGRLGCGSCYIAFQPFLLPLLRRIHGVAQHVGKQPVGFQKRPALKGNELETLKERLRKAVSLESFEEAARLRDQIRVWEDNSRRSGKRRKKEG